MTFEELNLNRPLLNALTDLGYESPTPIQEEAFPVVMSGRDVVGIAQTGTGKTFAYLLPILRQYKFSDQKHPRILIVVPTRELVLQVVSDIEKLSQYMNVRCAGVYGGTNINTQKQLVYNGLDILVATPGRLADLTLSGVLRLKAIQKLVIDEVDEMLNLGFRGQLVSLLETLPPKRQNLMFSATLSEDVDKLISSYFFEPEKVELAAHGTPLEKIIQKAYHIPNYNTKINLLELLLSKEEELTKVLVFVENKKLADKLYERIGRKLKHKVGVIHSNKSQNQRLNTLQRFKDGEHRVLIATDLVARGLNIPNVSHVINFDIPEVPGDYIHRIGRTGRADNDGIAITLVTDADRKYQRAIEDLMNKEINMVELPIDLIISQELIEEENPLLFDKDYLKRAASKVPEGAFHEKKGKNKKVNLGGPKKRNPKHGKPIRPKF
ncbi:MAG: DEAD/DEAH box helicase [Bacteroidota bacterium]|nr:DEAD/DEAH box helicase [Bacteroidota bacterium]